jgi:GMP synthase PP-ATPase subunit
MLVCLQNALNFGLIQPFFDFLKKEIREAGVESVR